MRGPLFALPIFLALAGATLAEPTFPYTAYITSDEVFVRSGPGDNYYPTDKLKAGTPVEVYRHDPGGWYAIRPPKDSFSWVSSRHLHLESSNLATVTDDRVASRIGSRLSDVRDIIQVRLHKGETVEVIEPRGRTGEGSSAAWYKIAPPAGEFRWISGRFVDRNYNTEGVRRNDTADRPSGRWQEDRDGQGGSLQRQIDRFDYELSAMIVQDPSLWDFRDLKHRAEAVFNQAETAAARGRARMMISKIDRFEDIKHRRETLAAAGPSLAPPAETPTRLPPVTGDGRYDAQGELIRVPNPKPGGPQYAILDSNGQLRSYVSPAPGVNLRSYVGRQVGVTGIRGYIPEERASHIMARHVNVVDGTELR